MHCPSCRSDQTQRLEVIFENGTQDIATTSQTSGVGVAGGRLGVGTSTTTTTGKSQSLLAQKLAPPSKKPLKPAVMFGIGGAICLMIGGGTMVFIGLMGIVGAVFLGMQASKYNSNEWPSLYQNWLDNWYCNKCGTVYHQSQSLSLPVAEAVPQIAG